MKNVELKGLSSEQVERLLPEGLISLCWRGSVAHGMYVPKSDPDSIDDKDVMGVYIGPLEHYLGFARKDVYEQIIYESELGRVFASTAICSLRRRLITLFPVTLTRSLRR